MKRLIVTGPARSDLRDIERYTRRTWGAEQAATYRGLLIQMFAKLMDKPRRGRVQPGLPTGARRINVRQHAIFYVDQDDDLVIAHSPSADGPDCELV